MPKQDPSITLTVPSDSYAKPQPLWEAGGVSAEVKGLFNEIVELESRKTDLQNKKVMMGTVEEEQKDKDTRATKDTQQKVKQELSVILDEQLSIETEKLKKLEGREPSESFTTQIAEQQEIVAKLTAQRLHAAFFGKFIQAGDELKRLREASPDNPIVDLAEKMLKTEFARINQDKQFNEFYDTEATFSQQLDKMTENNYPVKGSEERGTLIQALESIGAISASESSLLSYGLEDLSASSSAFSDQLKGAHKSSGKDIPERANNLVHAFRTELFNEHMRNIEVVSAGNPECSAVISRLQEESKGNPAISSLLQAYADNNDGKKLRELSYSTCTKSTKISVALGSSDITHKET